jgi:hypothetical protein
MQSESHNLISRYSPDGRAQGGPDGVNDEVALWFTWTVFVLTYLGLAPQGGRAHHRLDAAGGGGVVAFCAVLKAEEKVAQR